MTRKIINDGEISLNGVIYPLLAETKVQRQLISRFPNKVDIGDSSYGNELLRSNWIMNDQRSGIGVEEMNEAKDITRSWWSTCDLDYKGHLIPQPLATSLGSVGKTSPTGHTDPSSVWSSETQAYDGNLATGTVCNVGQGSWSGYLQLSVGAMTIVGLAVMVGRVSANLTQVNIDYTINGTDWVSVFSGAITAQMLARPNVFAVAAAGVTQMRIRFFNNDGVDTQPAYIYEAYFIGTTSTHTTFRACNFNYNTYFGVNDILCKVNSSTGAALVPVGIVFPANITDLVSTIGTQMCILLGDSDELWYMSTAEALTETDETGAYWGVHWDNKFFWINSTGTQLSYASTLAATLVETDNGVIPDGATVNGMMIYQDTNGDDIIYVGTRTTLWAHDFANAKFLATKLDFAEHPNACKGMVNWNTDAYISMGLHVKKYAVASSQATATSVGLDKDDGVPIEYSGEIVSFIKDSEQFYGLIDSTQYGTSGYSWVGKYNGMGWQCLWAEGSTNKAMHSGIVSTVYVRRKWFDSGNTIYYIPLQRTKVLPKKNSSYTYAASAVHITPWFDAGSVVFDKLALAVKTFCQDLTADETVVVKYRVNRATTAIASTWTTLVTLNSTAENNDITSKLSTTGSTGDGLVFSSIQFRLELARSTTTNAPDLQAVVMPYIKLDDVLYSWTFTIDLDAKKGTYDSRGLINSLETALAKQTLMEFTYRPVDVATDTHYVRIHPYSDLTNTGRNYGGKVQITVYDPSPS